MLVRILTEPRNAYVPQYQALFRMDKVIYCYLLNRNRFDLNHMFLNARMCDYSANKQYIVFIKKMLVLSQRYFQKLI